MEEARQPRGQSRRVGLLRGVGIAAACAFLLVGVVGMAYCAASLWLLYATGRRRIQGYPLPALRGWALAVNLLMAVLMVALSLDMGGIHGIEWPALGLALLGCAVLWLAQETNLRWARRVNRRTLEPN